jgi:hypothetical protein
MHPDPMWPINGTYRCPKCLRVYPVRWANGLPPHEGHNHTRSRIAA